MIESQLIPYNLRDKINTLFLCLQTRDPITAEHSITMAEYSCKLARIFDPEFSDLYYIGSLTHDIGKLAMPDHILKGNKKIKQEERKLLWQHVRDGVMLLSELGMPQIVIDIARYHHERYNGSGYLEGLNGINIPLCGRIAAISDTYSAMITARPYQPVKRPIEALKTLEAHEYLFDPEILKAMIELNEAEKKQITNERAIT
ncbi:HD domain-containing protein [Paenibacillus vini]|uniref:HD-GYP domain-containing protein n=1 Tax=Paenibacillus vini TaxID=1476024 RepID=UPI0025B67446|nr:HD domain-containing phosphohydrolase [Paenibacillus vini]MDN4067580.1 HD domain-containing protein [Paenibacillus vini]